jgi:hypothetical protein
VRLVHRPCFMIGIVSAPFNFSAMAPPALSECEHVFVDVNSLCFRPSFIIAH